MVDRRVTQVGVEVDILDETPTLRVTQVGVEVDIYQPEGPPTVWWDGEEITEWVNAMSLTMAYEAGDITRHDETAQVLAATIENGSSLSIGGLWDETLDGHLARDMFDGAVKAWAFSPYRPEGMNIKYSGNGQLTQYAIRPVLRGLVQFSATIAVTGGTTRGTW